MNLMMLHAVKIWAPRQKLQFSPPHYHYISDVSLIFHPFWTSPFSLFSISSLPSILLHNSSSAPHHFSHLITHLISFLTLLTSRHDFLCAVFPLPFINARTAASFRYCSFLHNAFRTGIFLGRRCRVVMTGRRLASGDRRRGQGAQRRH